MSKLANFCLMYQQVCKGISFAPPILTMTSGRTSEYFLLWNYSIPLGVLPRHVFILQRSDICASRTLLLTTSTCDPTQALPHLRKADYGPVGNDSTRLAVIFGKWRAVGLSTATGDGPAVGKMPEIAFEILIGSLLNKTSATDGNQWGEESSRRTSRVKVFHSFTGISTVRFSSQEIKKSTTLGDIFIYTYIYIYLYTARHESNTNWVKQVVVKRQFLYQCHHLLRRPARRVTVLTPWRSHRNGCANSS